MTELITHTIKKCPKNCPFYQKGTSRECGIVTNGIIRFTTLLTKGGTVFEASIDSHTKHGCLTHSQYLSNHPEQQDLIED